MEEAASLQYLSGNRSALQSQTTSGSRECVRQSAERHAQNETVPEREVSRQPARRKGPAEVSRRKDFGGQGEMCA